MGLQNKSLTHWQEWDGKSERVYQNEIGSRFIFTFANGTLVVNYASVADGPDAKPTQMGLYAIKPTRMTAIPMAVNGSNVFTGPIYLFMCEDGTLYVDDEYANEQTPMATLVPIPPALTAA